MERSPDSPELEDMPEPQEAIDLTDTIPGGEIDQYPVGLAYLREFFGSNPEELAVHTAMAGVEALEALDDVMRTGEDISVIGQKSLPFLDQLLSSLAEEEGRPAGFALLFYKSANKVGATIDGFKHFVLGVRDQLNDHFSHNIHRLSISDKYTKEQDDVRNNLRPALRSLQLSFEMFLNSYFEEVLIEQPQGELDDDWIFREFCDPFYLARRADLAREDRRRCGFSGQVLYALMEKARAMEIPGVEEIVLQPNEK